MRRSWVNAIKGLALGVVLFFTGTLIWTIVTLPPFWRNARTYTTQGVLLFAFTLAIIGISVSIHGDKG